MSRNHNSTLFQQIDDLREVKKKSAQGATSILLSQGVTLVINVGALSILARSLEPRLFGLIGMIAAVTNFAMIFQDLGFSMATIQSKSITHEQASSLFWINSTLGLMIAICLWLLSPLIANFYGETELIGLTTVIAISFVFSGMSVQYQALIRRRMQFLHLALIRCSGILLANILGVLIAIHGGGAWSLAVIQVSISLFDFLGGVIVLQWIPSLPKIETPIKQLLSFGSNIAGFSIVTYFARNLDKILIGRVFGEEILGFYSKAYELMLLPLTRLRGPILGVASPALSGLKSNEKEYASYFLNFISLLGIVSFPLILCLVVCSHQLVYLVLGQDWIQTVVLFRWLGCAAILQPFNWALGILLVSSHQSRRYLIWGGLHSSIIVLSFFIGIAWSAKGVAIAYASASAVLFFPSVVFCTVNSVIKIGDILQTIWIPFIGGLFSTALVLIVERTFTLQSQLGILLAKIVIFGVTYTLSLSLFPNARRKMIATFKLLKNVIPCLG